MPLWIGQDRNQRQQFDERTRPAVAQDERNPPPVCRTLVDEVDLEPVEVGAELIDRIQRALLRPPIEPVGPVGKQLSEVGEVRALVPGGAGCRIGPACVSNTLIEIGQDAILNVDPKGCDA
jgi:hypothetical protein